MGKRIYADWCCLQRAFDQLDTAEKRREEGAFAYILGAALDSPPPSPDQFSARYRIYEDPEENGGWGLVYSDALRYEIDKCPDPDRRRWASRVFVLLGVDKVRTNDHVAGRWRQLTAMKHRISRRKTSWLKEKDAWHLALAEAAHADVLVTTDRPFYNWSLAKQDELRVPVKKPENFSPTLIGEYRISSWLVGPHKPVQKKTTSK